MAKFRFLWRSVIMRNHLFLRGIPMKNRGKLVFAILFLLFSSINMSFAQSNVTVQPYFFARHRNIENASTQKATLENIDRMFWKLSGFDSKGRPATVYMLGTIHIGDDRLFPLPESVMNAFWSAKRVAAEISSDDMEDIQSELVYKMMESMQAADGRNVLDYLTEEEKATAMALGEEVVTTLSMFEPWVMLQALSTGAYSKSGLEGVSGIDMYLMQQLAEEEEPWEGLDTLETQIDVLSFGDYDQQLYLLKGTLDQIVHPENNDRYISTLYNAYLSGDIDTIAKITEEEMTPKEGEMKEFEEAYYNALMYDRNKAWSQKIAGWIKEGGTTFIFAGCAHFAGNKSVFHYLRENGVIE